MRDLTSQHEYHAMAIRWKQSRGGEILVMRNSPDEMGLIVPSHVAIRYDR